MADQWIVQSGGKQLRPMTTAQLKHLAATGKLQPTDLVRKEGTSKFIPASAVKGLFPPAAPKPLSLDDDDNPPPADGDQGTDRPAPRSGKIPWVSVGVGAAVLAVVAMVAIGVGANKRRNADVPAADDTVQTGRGAPAPLARPLAGGLDPVVGDGAEPKPPAPIPPPLAAKDKGPVDKGPDDARSGADLDALLRLLSHNYYLGYKEIRRPNESEWTKAVTALRTSPNKEVAATAVAAEPAVLQRAFALTLKEKMEAENRAIAEESAPYSFPWAKSILSSGASDEALDEAVKRGSMSRAAADAYRKERNQAQASGDAAGMVFIGGALKAYANRKLTEDKITALHVRAEAVEGGSVSENLIPALRARAGAKIAAAPLELVFDIAKDAGFRYTRFRATAVSSSDKELTRVTVLVKLSTYDGPRFVCVYIPKLKANESFRISPLLYFPSAGRNTYSIWCDQFTVEDVNASYKNFLMASAVPTLTPGSAFVADAPHKGGPKPDRSRFDVAVTKLTPIDDGYQVEVEISRWEAPDRSKLTGKETCTGPLRLITPEPPKKGTGSATARPPYLLCSLRGATTKLDLKFGIQEDGQIRWSTEDRPFADRNFRPRELADQGDRNSAETKENFRVILRAGELARQGDRAGAEKMLKEFIATSPGKRWEDEANQLLNHLDFYVEQGAKPQPKK